jgi:GTPase SAR1 family protein
VIIVVAYLTQYNPERLHNLDQRIPVILVGCKSDKRNGLPNTALVTYEQIAEVTTQIECLRYMECSAVTGVGVKEVFEESLRVSWEDVPNDRKNRRRNTGDGCMVA